MDGKDTYHGYSLTKVGRYPGVLRELIADTTVQIDKHCQDVPADLSLPQRLAKVLELYQLSETADIHDLLQTDNGFPYLLLNQALEKEMGEKTQTLSEGVLHVALEMIVLRFELNDIPQVHPKRLERLRNILVKFCHELADYRESRRSYRQMAAHG